MVDNATRAIALHTLLVSDLTRSVRFYCERFGMTEQQRITGPHGEQHGLLTFAPASLAQDQVAGAHPGEANPTTLHLVQKGTNPEPRPTGRTNNARNPGYWKIGATLSNIDRAAEQLRSAGVEVSEPRQFRDIGYLCHLADPDGHTIELLQHTFGAAPTSVDSSSNDTPPLGSHAQFGQITLRVRDPKASLRFYRDVMKMKLLSRQEVPPHRFTLYFLAYTEESPPNADINAVENREWLWQRPYTTLELQHRWGTEEGGFRYRISDVDGFDSLSVACPDLPADAAALNHAGYKTAPTKRFTSVFGETSLTVHDPDGYAVRLLGDDTP